MNCPHPLARAPRLASDSHAQFYFSPPSLKEAVTAVVTRDLRGLSLTSAQCLNHFPASPFPWLVCRGIKTIQWVRFRRLSWVLSGNLSVHP